MAVKATRKAIETLREADPVMGRLIEEHGALVRRDLKRERPGDAYGALLRSIVGQQLSTKAASTIYGRMLELFGGHAPTPKQLLKADPDKIRAAGLSRPKIAYLRDLAQHVEEGDARAGAPARPARRGGGRPAHRHQGPRPVDRGHVPDVPPRPAGRAPGGRPGHPARGQGGVPAAQVPRRRSAWRSSPGPGAPTARWPASTSGARWTTRRPDRRDPARSRSAPPARARPAGARAPPGSAGSVASSLNAARLGYQTAITSS